MRSGFLLFMLLIAASMSVQAGVSIGGTRVIYGEKQQAATLALRNNSDFTWLINSKVTAGGRWPGSMAATVNSPFVIVPPLFALKAGRESRIRIINTGENLPHDRESLFTLSIAAIPSGKVAGNSVQIAVRSRLKLFYRPAGLHGQAQHSYQQLHWSRSGEKLVVSNPTPYYVTLFKLKVNGQNVANAGMVAPFSQRETDWCQSRGACALDWQSINDYGRVMPAVSVRATSAKGKMSH